ncbi:class I SAM-dependent methyltransferase [Enteractinococcus fodinae]|uniref:SAM-dependent methyltransferase n=1 Tax=Enteractinococcus fodinae TaxID=684663 RepID=A0ABU2B241_9MICC|nr:class I SAM-dependent methyltransferase [Enteractinococcus fodinae]MDR7347677.1 SAM-dependent methyltransferase [Enteractinococcus fodinae]
MEDASQQSAHEWDQRYQTTDRLWSGAVNAAVATMVEPLHPGTALDLGCGEGADVIWLAEHGWQATGVDISHVAIQRATEAAHERGLDQNQASFVVADVTTWESAQRFDLVTAAFLQSQGTFDRGAALHTATAHVALGGFLLVVSHATFPPWATSQPADDDHAQHKHEPTTPETELELLALDPTEWRVEVATTQSRQATGPEGQQVTLDDTVVLARRTGAHQATGS